LWSGASLGSLSPKRNGFHIFIAKDGGFGDNRLSDDARNSFRLSLIAPEIHAISGHNLVCMSRHKPNDLRRSGSEITVYVKVIRISLKNPCSHEPPVVSYQSLVADFLTGLLQKSGSQSKIFPSPGDAPKECLELRAITALNIPNRLPDSRTRRPIRA
jgi:hypothetical protein